MTPELHQQTVDQLAAIGSKATYTGAGATAVGWILSSQFGVLFGILLGVSGLLMNFYYSRKRDKREEADAARREAEHQLRMILRNDRHDLMEQGADE